MTRNLKIKVKSKAEFEAVKASMEDKEFRAMAVIYGTLLPYSKESQQFIADTVIRYFDLPKNDRL